MIRTLINWFDTRRLATAIVFVAIFATAVRVPADSDAWWHLQAGRVTVENREILQTDLFSHPRYGSAWVNHSWLSQIVLYGLFNLLSYAGLGLLVAAVATAAFVLVYRQMEGDPFSRALIIVLAAATSSVIWSPRPQIFSFLLTATTAYILFLFKWKGINRLWLLPPMFILWANLHAGYALGFMILVAFVIGEAFNHIVGRFIPSDDPVLGWREIGLVVGVALLSVLLLVINPNTTKMWTYYLDTVNIDALRDYIQEWRSPDFHPLFTHPFIWLLLGTLGAMGLSGRRADGTDLALVGMFAYASLLAARNIGPFALVVAPALSRHTAAFLARCGWEAKLRKGYRHTQTRGAINLALLILIVLAALVKVQAPLNPAVIEQTERDGFPVDAVAASEISESAKTSVVPIEKIPDGQKGLDIGPKTIELFSNALKDAKTVVWNGPMGVFECKPFAPGTVAIAKILAEITGRGAVTVVGGGDSAAAVSQAGLDDKLTHISTGGGASLEFLEGKILPGVAALTDNSKVEVG